VTPKPLVDHLQKRDPLFRWRVREPSRVEGLSDAVFGFSVTLLVISLEVPRTFDAMLHDMGGYLSFLLGFVMLMVVWYQQFLWFRRYGLDDVRSVVLNLALLAVVIFYVYPLKFLGNVFAILARVAPPTVVENGTTVNVITLEQMPTLMIIYGIGFVAIYGILFLLYRHAWRRREPLGLTPVEMVETRFSMIESVIMISVGILSVAVAAVSRSGFASGMCFMLLAPAQAIQGSLHGRAKRALRAADQSEEARPG
jgi:uncharacterized membrane protein